MKNLIIKGTEEAPEINFLTDGILSMSGVSIPENVHKFYEPVNNWLAEFENNLPKNIVLTIDFEYVNSSTLNMLIYKIFSKIVSFSKLGTELKVIWIYPNGDDDIEDMGKNLEDVLNFKFEFNCK